MVRPNNFSNHACLFICMVVCIVYCSLLTYKYFLNESSTRVSIKRLKDSPTIAHPAITVCLHAPQGNIFLNFDDRKNISKKEYYQLLTGVDSKSYYEWPKLEFQKSIMPSYGYLRSIAWKYVGGSKNRRSGNEIPIYDSYLDPNEQCFTFQSISTTSEALEFVRFKFNDSNLQEIDKGSLTVFLHHPGQLIGGSGQFLYYTYIMRNIHQITQNTKALILIQINQIKLIRDRPDGNQKCNFAINKNQDIEWMKSVTKIVGCVPTYWSHLLRLDHFPNCTLTEQLNEAAKYHMKPHTIPGTDTRALALNKNSEMFFELHKPPCHEMQISSSILQMKNKKGGSGFSLFVEFATEKYEDVNNIREYELTSMLAEIGGYVGVFLGFSIFQGLINCAMLLNWARERNKTILL